MTEELFGLASEKYWPLTVICEICTGCELLFDTETVALPVCPTGTLPNEIVGDETLNDPGVLDVVVVLSEILPQPATAIARQLVMIPQKAIR